MAAPAVPPLSSPPCVPCRAVLRPKVVGRSQPENSLALHIRRGGAAEWPGYGRERQSEAKRESILESGAFGNFRPMPGIGARACAARDI